MKLGLYGMEVFELSFYNMNIFLKIGDILDAKNNFVEAYELETYEFEGKDALCLNEKRTGFVKKADPLLDKHEFHYIKNGNDFLLPIEIKFGDRIYCMAERACGITIAPGIYYAEMVGDGTNKAFYELADTAFKRRISNCKKTIMA